ncbi:NADH-quinone oxidoreductase subunit J [Halopenitus persicus]|jgi:NADH-quinone oxidoreductase subunit J|uniref:NADH-quinone oxidoreductase subunit J n=1 Tax=Halopenitus persicus TaxID=1048396 RepID=A0A1H3J6Y3_9EURY|nr:NADH-quinone oxidoreductase subunit J [Halopenitus persicus]SDY35299.1 NADH-quinone oxidoreductase subunit J [Halopenitus persicus]
MSDDPDTRERDGPDEYDVSDRGLVPGLASLLLFGVLAVTILGADFGDPAGLEAGEYGITHGIGFALFNVDLGAFAGSTEGFLAAFFIVAITLDVAIDGALYLAKRESDGSIVSAVGGTFTRGRKAGEGGD